MNKAMVETVLASEPAAVDADVLWAGLDRGELRKQHAAGELQELEFEAVVFRAQYPNRNYVRFRDEEMAALAGSFVGVPFLRNHDMQDIAARDGIVTAAWMDGEEMHARIRLTTEEGMRDFLAGRIDRFSISWFKHGATLCSVCGKDVFGAECRHVPGRMYGENCICEMVQVGPVGREISAVNVPAAAGTHVLGEFISELVAWKEQMMEQQDGVVDGTAPRSAHQDVGRGSGVAPSEGRGDCLGAIGDGRGEVDGVKAEFLSFRDDVVAELKELKLARNRLQLETALERSGLPESAQVVIRQVAQQQPECLDMDNVDRLIAAQKAMLAEAVQPSVVSGLRPISAHDLRTGLDDMQEALDWCLGCRAGRHRRRRCATSVTCTWP